MKSSNGWGGVREGAGRPKNPNGIRKQRQLRAYDDEWDVIQRLARLVKYGNREACEKFLLKMEKKTE